MPVLASGNFERMIEVLTASEVRYSTSDRWNLASEGKKFRCKMIEPGLVSYRDQPGGGIELLRKETIERCLNSAIGNPLTIGHVNVTAENRMDIENGIVEGAEAGDDGWFYVYGTVDTENAKSLIRRGQAPSCAYAVKTFGPGGTYHGIKYDREISELIFNHLAIVEKPRYEGSSFRMNSMSVKQPTMNVIKFLKKLVTRVNGADGNPVETVTVSTTDIPLDTEIEIDGNPVRMNSLIDAWKAGTKAVFTASAEDEVEIDGAKVKMNELVDCYKNSKMARQNAADEAAKKKSDEEAEKSRQNSLSEEQRKAEAEKSDRKNSAFFTLHAAREKGQVEGGYSTTANSLKEKVERGSKKY